MKYKCVPNNAMFAETKYTEYTIQSFSKEPFHKMLLEFMAYYIQGNNLFTF